MSGDSVDELSLTHALHTVGRRLAMNWNSAQLGIMLRGDATTSHCQAKCALMIRSQADHRSTLSGGGHLGIEHGFESPKHRDSLLLSMS